MKYSKYILLIALTFMLSSCYNAKLVTDKKPSGKKIEKKWAASFINGLVPPKTVRTAQRCPNGIAKVETKLSFLNQLVAGLTLSIYTPMKIDVSCAQKSGAASVIYGEPNIKVAKNARTKARAQIIH